MSGQYLISLINHFKGKNYVVKIFYVFLDNTDLCIERIKIRVAKGGHHIPDDIVIRRFYRSFNNFWNIYRRLCNSWYIIYNGEEGNETVAYGDSMNTVLLDEFLFTKFIEHSTHNE